VEELMAHVVFVRQGSAFVFVVGFDFAVVQQQ